MLTLLKNAVKSSLILVAISFATVSFADPHFGPSGVWIRVGEPPSTLYRLNTTDWGQSSGYFNTPRPLFGGLAGETPTYLGIPDTLIIHRGIVVTNWWYSIGDRWRIFWQVHRVGGETTPWAHADITNVDGNTTGLGNNRLHRTDAIAIDILALARTLAPSGEFELRIGIRQSTSAITETSPEEWRTATFRIFEGVVVDPTINITMNDTEFLRNEQANFSVNATDADSVAVLHNNVVLRTFSSNATFPQQIPLPTTELDGNWITAIAMNNAGRRTQHEVDFVVRDSVRATWHLPTGGTNVPHNVPLELVVNLFDADSAVLSLNGYEVHRVQNQDVFTFFLQPDRFRMGSNRLDLAVTGFRGTTANLNKTFSVVQQGTNIVDVETGCAPSLRIFPNPARNYLILQGSDLVVGSEISIFNVFGRLVGTYRVVGEETTIDVSGLSAGLYVLRVDGVVFRWVRE